jgi:hypothetical protein
MYIKREVRENSKIKKIERNLVNHHFLNKNNVSI